MQGPDRQDKNNGVTCISGALCITACSAPVQLLCTSNVSFRVPVPLPKLRPSHVTTLLDARGSWPCAVRSSHYCTSAQSQPTAFIIFQHLCEFNVCANSTCAGEFQNNLNTCTRTMRERDVDSGRIRSISAWFSFSHAPGMHRLHSPLRSPQTGQTPRGETGDRLGCSVKLRKFICFLLRPNRLRQPKIQ